MKKQTLGLFLGTLAGLGGLIWLLRKTGRAFQTFDINIVLKGLSAGGCGVQSLTPDLIELSKRSADIARWRVENPENGGCAEVSVRITGWERDGYPVNAPVHGPLSASVRPGKAKHISGIVKFTAENGDYTYFVEIDGQQALDPKVRVVD
jgi:hypothetical protein